MKMLPPAALKGFDRLRAMKRPSLTAVWMGGAYFISAVAVFLVAVETFAAPGLLAKQANKPIQLTFEAELDAEGNPLPGGKRELSPFNAADSDTLDKLQKPIKLSTREAKELIDAVGKLSQSLTRFRADFDAYSKESNLLQGSVNSVSEQLWGRLVSQGFKQPRLPKVWYDQVERGGPRLVEEAGVYLAGEFTSNRIAAIKYRILGEEIKQHDREFIDGIQELIDERPKMLDGLRPPIQDLLKALETEGVTLIQRHAWP